MKTSRRSALAALAGAAVAPHITRAATKATAFGLIGDRYHNSDYARSALNRTIQQDLGVTIDLRMKPSSSMRNLERVQTAHHPSRWHETGRRPIPTKPQRCLVNTGKPKLTFDRQHQDRAKPASG